MQALHLFENSWSNKISSILLFCVPFFFIIFADSLLSFIFPIVVADTLKSNGLMGLIMAASSVVGLICDFTFPQLFKTKSWKFFLLGAIILAFTFPIAIYLGKEFTLAWAFLYGSVIWGVYFEFIMFSEQLFVVNEDNKINYSKDWALISLTWQTTSIIAPILASALLLSSIQNTTLTIVIIQAMALMFAIFVIFSIKNKRNGFVNDESYKYKVNVLTELKYWKVLLVRVWPTVSVGIIITAIQAAFWTIGGIYGIQVFGESGMEWLIISLFFFPMILGSLIITKLKPQKSKQKISQISLIFGALILGCIAFAGDNHLLIVSIIVLASFLLSFVQPLNDAVYSDLLDRLGEQRSHLLGISRANSSIAYILTPIFVGFISDLIGYSATFGLIAIISALVGIVTFFFSPKLIKLPQGQLKEISETDII